jgi:glycosyltransferase involved in cell wall biosynthesis
MVMTDGREGLPHGKSGYCFVLGWSLDNDGGVTEVVRNLGEEFRKSSLWEPLVLEAQWDASTRVSAPTHTIKRSHFRLRSPYDSNRPFSCGVAFLRHLPGDFRLLRRLVREHNIAVFNPHFVGGNHAILVLLKRLGLYRGKVILSIHGSDIREGHQTKGAGRFWWKFMLRNADAVVACSEGLREEAQMLEPRAHVFAIHNGIDIARFRSTSAPNVEWPPEFAGKKVIVNVGDFQYRKGHDILLRAFCEVLKQHPDSVLLLIGKPGPASAPLRNLQRELELGHSVHILERVPHERICGYLQHSSVFVMASRWRKGEMGEGFPLAILEAAAAGICVVSTASTGVAELIEDRVTGRLVALENPRELGLAICEVLSDRSGARIMADNLCRLVQERFTWVQAADKYSALATAIQFE